ncbi:MAG: DUF3631 domain-containing protein [Gammaproteobacteria bacterium]
MIADGLIHRFPTNGRASDASGWYILFSDGIYAGAYGDWRTGIQGKWCQSRPDELPAQQYQAAIERMHRKCEEQREAAELRREESAKTAAAVWDECLPVERHEYLSRKGIDPHGTRVSADGYLVIPVYSAAGAIQSLQFISPDGEKRFLPGGAIAGGYFPIGTPDGVICVAEGFATGCSVYGATGFATAISFNSGNLLPVAQALRAKFPKIKIVLCADDDAGTPGNPGLTKATEAALATGAFLATPDFGPNRLEGVSDLNDQAAYLGLESVRTRIEKAEKPSGGMVLSPDTDGAASAVISRLAALSPIEYDRAREAEAQALGVRTGTLDKEVAKARGALGVRTGTLDKEVAKARGETAEEAKGQGQTFETETLEPWHDPVDGANLLKDLAAVFLQRVVMPLAASTILALWVLHTYCYDLRRCTPILGLISPQKRCGKTTLMSVLVTVVNRPVAASNISPSCVYRAIDLWHPTLLIDEADSFLRDNEELRGIMNSGHMKGLAYVIRAVGDEHEPRQFSTWAPKVMALIGKLPSTLHDRAIVIELARKTPEERVERLAGFDGTELRRRCLRWAQDSASAIRAADPDIPAGIHDRAADNWGPLLAIADTAGGDWPALARQAMAAQPDEPDDSVAVMLLADIRQFFEDGETDRSLTANLVAYLTGLEERPWNDWRRGKPLTPNQLARLLAPFKIKPGTLRVGGDRAKGYRLEDFGDAFTRYLPLKGGYSIRDTVTMASQLDPDDFRSVTTDNDVTDLNPPKPAPQLDCHGVTDRNTPLKGERGVEVSHGGDGQAWKIRI